MRIITGTARGCRLKTPKGLETRPTSDRVRESLFNILGPMVSGRHVLDVFAGTGSLGLEALSRRAASAVFVDQATSTLLKENAGHTGLLPMSEIHGGDVFACLARFAAAGRSFDLIFCDPPYHKGLWQRALSVFDTTGILSVDGILVVEHGADESQLPPLTRLVCVDNRRYGHTTQISFFQWKSYVEEADS